LIETLPTDPSVVNEVDALDQVPAAGALPLTKPGKVSTVLPEQVEPT
jgi:hypothetical protein